MAESSHPEMICHSCEFKWQIFGVPPSTCPLCRSTSIMSAPNPPAIPQPLYRVEATNDPYRESHLVMEGEHEIDQRQYRKARAVPRIVGYDASGWFWKILFFGMIIAVIGWISYPNIITH